MRPHRSFPTSALAPLVTKHQPWLFRRALHLCRNRADAEDLVQETILRFLAFFGARPQAPGENASASWLASTLKNCLNDHHRRQRVRERATINTPAHLDLEVPAESPEPSPYDRIPEQALDTAIHALSPGVRRTLAMHLRGRRNPEIAGELGIKVNAVARRLHLARSKLRVLLRPLLRSAA